MTEGTPPTVRGAPNGPVSGSNRINNLRVLNAQKDHRLDRLKTNAGRALRL
jgi:hypothetical protein